MEWEDWWTVNWLFSEGNIAEIADLTADAMLSAKCEGLPGLGWSPEGIDSLGLKRTEPKLLWSKFD